MSHLISVELDNKVAERIKKSLAAGSVLSVSPDDWVALIQAIEEAQAEDDA